MPGPVTRLCNMMSDEKVPVLGAIHSTESFGAVDGPGIRFLIFLKGCRMRCRYCHNVDTWNPEGAEMRGADSLLDEAERFRAYWGKKGGITVSGGEPLLQIDFLEELFRKAKERGIHTVLDTCGQPFTREEPFFSALEKVIDNTDLVLLDLKEMDSSRHKSLTGWENRNILEFAEYLSDRGVKMWIRHVLVPGVTDQEDDLTEMRRFTDSLKTVEKVEILPYHNLGESKWEKLGIPYTLHGVEPPTAEEIRRAEAILIH